MLKSKIKRVTIQIMQLLLLVGFCLWLLGGGYGDKYSNYKIEDALLFAHRGLPDFPENTKLSFDNAISAGFNAIETDVNITKDNKLVLFHDNDLQRLIGRGEMINDVEYENLKNDKIIFNGNESKENIMNLKDFLNRYKLGTHIYLDIKSSKKVVADQLLTTLEELESIDRIYIADSNLLFLTYLSFKNPKVKTILEGFNSGKEWIYYLIPKNYKPTSFASFFSAVDKKHIEWLNAKNLNHRKIVYGLDSTNYIKAAELGVKNVIIDYNNNMGQVLEIKNLLK